MSRAVRLAMLIGSSVAILLVVCTLLELGLIIHESRREAARASAASHYPWSFFTSDGMRVGPGRGPLHLVLKPLLLFGNRPDQKTPQFTVNSLGLRGPSPSSTAGRPRVVLLGGSTAFGTGLRNDDETFAHQLGALLDVEVVNAAVIGYQSSEELVDLLTRLVDLRPDLVITLDGWNDYGFPPLFWTFESQLKVLQRLTQASVPVRLAHVPLVLFPRTWRWVGDRLDVLRSKIGPNAAASVDIAAAATAYARNMIKMRTLGTAFGFQFICFIQPQRFADTLAYQAYRDQVVRLLADAKVRYVDFNEEPHARRMPDALFMDGVHVGGAGNRVMAEIAADEIRRAGVLGRPATPAPR